MTIWNLELGPSAEEIAKLAASVPSSEGVRCVPAFIGLFAPQWRDDARGIVFGLTLYLEKAHLARAAIDAASFQTAEIFDTMKMDSGVRLSHLKVETLSFCSFCLTFWIQKCCNRSTSKERHMQLA